MNLVYNYRYEAVRYYGFVANGAHEGEFVTGYGFYTLKGKCYIFGNLAGEYATDPKWYHVKREDIHFEVVTLMRRF